MPDKFLFNYIDLFAGIGGFHQAMDHLGGKCIGASEIDQNCIDTYSLNYPDVKMLGDINDIQNHLTDIDEFQVLCAGFPCQPFSKAGKRQGFKDEVRGRLFYKTLNILEAHPETEFIILENVRNLADRDEYWDTIQNELANHNFAVTQDKIILSPTNFGIPQLRERVFILGIRNDLKDNSKLPNSFIKEDDLGLEKCECSEDAAFKILDNNVDDAYLVPPERERMLLAWDEFRKETSIKVIGYPIWISCFGVGDNSDSSFYKNIKLAEMPKWKQNFVKKNRHFYHIHRDFIDPWIQKYDMLNQIKLYQKFEWNCGTDVSDIKHGLIQVRQSGIRVKRPNYFPALVAIDNTPIVWDWEKAHFRKITPREASRLQNFDEDYDFLGTDRQQYKALGNSVNVYIIEHLALGLFNLRKHE